MEFDLVQKKVKYTAFKNKSWNWSGSLPTPGSPPGTADRKGTEHLYQATGTCQGYFIFHRGGL